MTVSPDSRLKWFEAAFKEKFPDTTVDDLCKSIKLDPSTFRTMVANGQSPDSMSGYVLEGILGCGLFEFVEKGRTMEEGENPAPTGEAPPAAENEEILKKAAQILKAGGANAVTLKNIIKLMASGS